MIRFLTIKWKGEDNRSGIAYLGGVVMTVMQLFAVGGSKSADETARGGVT